MIVTVSILTSLIFSVIYPLFFWISWKDPLKNNFHKFHIALPNVIGGVTVVFLLLMNIPLTTKIIVVLWKAVFIIVSRYSWKKEYPDTALMSMASLFGAYAFFLVQSDLTGATGIIPWFVWVWGGLIFCAVLFAMNLGHWYLNVHGLPIHHLLRATYALGIALAVRALWDSYFLLIGKVFYDGQWIALARFLMSLDGFLLGVGLFFGTLFPLGSLYFVRATLHLRNTQAATGILYVLLASILIGDITYKYYMIKFGIYL